MKSRLPRTTAYAERVELAMRRPGHAAPPGSFVNPIRINRTKQHIGDYPSALMGKALPYHSSHELLLLELADRLPFVTFCWPQPQSFKFVMEEKWRSYTPDAALELSGSGKLMIEVKEAAEIDRAANVQRWRAVDDAIRQAGFMFAIASDDLVLTESLRANLTKLARFRHYRFEEAELESLGLQLVSGPQSIGALRSRLDAACGARLVEAAIFHKRAFVDLWQPLTEDTLISCAPPDSTVFLDRLRSFHAGT